MPSVQEPALPWLVTFVSWTGVDSDSLNNLGFFLILLEPKTGSRLCESEAEIRAAEIEKEEQRKMYHLYNKGVPLQQRMPEAAIQGPSACPYRGPVHS